MNAGMNARAVSVFLLIAASSWLQPSSAAEAHRQHGAHVHGEATLNIALDGQLLLISLEAPGMSVLGFEHPPRDDGERTLYRHALEVLGMPERWLTVPAAAACALESSKVEPHGFASPSEGGQTAEHGGPAAPHAEDAHHEHADFDVAYRYACHVPLAVRILDVRLFDVFPDLHKINVELVLPDRQGSQVLLPGTTAIPFSQ
jgi:hypothetical protein